MGSDSLVGIGRLALGVEENILEYFETWVEENILEYFETWGNA